MNEKNLMEKGKGTEKVGINQQAKVLERATESAVWKISRWASEEDREAGRVYSEEEALRLFKAPQFTEIKGNILLNVGINELFTLICSSSGTKFDNANAQIGVGDGTTAEDATQTDLQGTNKAYVGMMTGYPTYGSGQKATWKSSFDGSTGNYAWNEFVVRNGATAAKCLNRKVSSQGTKSSGQVWEVTLEITLS